MMTNDWNAELDGTRPADKVWRKKIASDPGYFRTDDNNGIDLRRPGDRRLFPKLLEPVRQFGPARSLVRELSDKQRERLGVSGDPQRAGIHWIET